MDKYAETGRDSWTTFEPRYYYDGSSSSDDNSNENFILTVIILAVCLHVALLILVCYCVCCRKNDRPLEPSYRGGIGRRYSVGHRHTTYRRHRAIPSNQNANESSSGGSGYRTFTHSHPNTSDESGNSSTTGPTVFTSDESGNSSTTSPTVFQTGLRNWRSTPMSGLRIRVDLPGRAVATPPTPPMLTPQPPPPYDAGGEEEVGGVTNPVVVVEVGEGNDLPSYDDYLQELPTGYIQNGSGSYFEQPPAYDDIVKQPPR